MFQNAQARVTTLKDCAAIFVEQMLGVSKDSLQYKDCRYLMEKYLKMKFNNNTSHEDNFAAFTKLMGMKDEQCRLLHDYVKNVVQTAVEARERELAMEYGINLEDLRKERNPNHSAVVVRLNNLPNSSIINTAAPFCNRTINNTDANSNPNDSPMTNRSLLSVNITRNTNDHPMFPHVSFVQQINFHYVETPEFPSRSICCFFPLSSNGNVALKMRPGLSKHLTTCIKSRGNGMFPSLLLAQLRVMREVASIVEVDPNPNELQCHKANIKFFCASKQIFGNYLNKFEKCMSSCCSYDIQLFMERNPQYCSPGRPISCTTCPN